ncbi:hypothetical protein HDU99_006180, partial [Rhizoclosmatium hyalinum]
EKSRQAKNFAWKANEPVTLFPNWQDEYYTNTQQTSPSRNSRPGSTTDSPVILPGTFASNAPPLVAPSTPGISAPPPTGLYTPDFRSPSPVFFAEEYDDDDAASYVSSATSSSLRNTTMSNRVGGSNRFDSPFFPSSTATSSVKGGHISGRALRHRNLNVSTGGVGTPILGASTALQG